MNIGITGGMDKEKFLQSGLLEQHVLGITSPKEEEIVQAYLRAHPELQDWVVAYRRELDNYAVSQLPDLPPPSRPAGVDRGDILYADALTVGAPVRWSLLLALLLGTLSVFMHRQNAALRGQLQHAKAEFAALKTHCAQERERQNALYPWIALLQSPQTRALLLTSDTQAQLGVAYWNPKTRQAYLAPVWLPSSPDGHQYQVWADVHGEMVSIGLVPKGHGPTDMIELDYLGGAASINITLELAGGAEHPNLEALVGNVVI